MADIASRFGIAAPPQLDLPEQTKGSERGIIVRDMAGQHLALEVKWGFLRPQKDRVVRAEYGSLALFYEVRLQSARM
jgi:hypothetical protein